MKDTGFSLIEVLVATTIMVVAVVSLAELSVMSILNNTRARATTMTLLVAEQKMEQLRGDGWGVTPSPSGTLSANTVGWVDYVDPTGVSLGGVSTTLPAGAEYIRRWSVEPLPGNPGNTMVLQVLVTRHRNRGAADTAPGVGRLPEETRLVSVSTRKAM